MFPTFTGTSRRPRQVNLSGRNSNPFAGIQQSPNARGTPSAVAQAQEERRARQQERQRLQAAQTIQKTWRGHAVRKSVRRRIRTEWDGECQRHGLDTRSHAWTRDVPPEAVISLLKRLLQFASARNVEDQERLALFARLFREASSIPAWHDPSWSRPIVKLLRLALLALRQRTFSLAVALEDRKHSKNRKHDPDRILSDYLELLLTIVNRSYDVTESLGFYYSTLAELVSSGTLLETDPGPITETVSSGSWEEGPRKQILQALICVPLRPKGTRSTDKAYESFSTQFLTYPNLPRFLDFDHIARGLSLERLNGAVLSSSDEDTAPAFISRLSKDRRLAFLAYYIHIFRVHADIMPQGSLSQNAVQTLNEAYGRLQALRARGEPTSLEASFLRIVTLTLSDAVSELDSGLDFVSAATNPWMREYILGQTNTLIDREFMTQLLETTSRELPGLVNVKPTQNLAALMANYILVLLQLFPQRKNDIRLWIYAKWFVNVDAAGTKRATSALRFFWDAFSYTGVFHRILETPKAAVEMMRDGRNLQEQPERYSQDQAWRVGFLFLELYSFALRIMDDEEFTRGFASFANVDGSNMLSASSLTLKQVQDLSRFLKNLAYAVYWHSSDILKNGDIDPENRSFADYFGRAPRPQRRVEEPLPTAKGDVVVAGIRWANFGYVKGMVTGVLKALYERDSRRPFLPKDHWLMPQFDMAGFIPVVVEEQQYRMEHDEDTEMDEDALDADEDTTHDVNYVGNSRTMQQIRAERMRKRMERASRKKTLENVTPRLEILQNMPFFIPFATRVQIFREFVAMDQRRRRGGVTDPDQWRMRMADSHNLFVAPGGPRAPTYDLSRHAARVRREYIFEDAYQQFFALGDGLKEPIQITFVDRFGAPEPGIDGGGVTKEFLTSVTAEAFTTSPDPVDTLFVENDEHLLYPNPGFFDGLRDQMRREGEREGGPEWNTVLREAAARYEFLGRVVGKCLYEGILVDIHFAPFFLVKWALTGGSGFAANESSYLASVNDLRDLDKDLYQGLLKLKHYTGNVADDFGLDFTVTDEYWTTDAAGRPVKKTTERPLRADGAATRVTNENRALYVYAVARHRLVTQPLAATRAFLRGLGALVQPSWLAMFNAAELQTLLGGDAAEIDVADLRGNTQYSGAYAVGDDGQEHPTVRMFWRVLRAMADAERRQVLKYVTSTPRGPLLGFAALNPRFTIRDSGSDQSRLPSTSTCVNLLKLPIYTSEAVLREKLVYAVNSGAGFDLS